MSGIIAQGRYRVTAFVLQEPGYQAVKCIDITSRDHQEALANRYTSSEAVKRALPVIQKAREADIKGMIGLATEAGVLNAIFEMPRGQPLEGIFGGKNAPKREDAQQIAHSFMHYLLEMANMPPEIAYAASRAENVYVQEKTLSASPRMLIRPEQRITTKDVTRQIALSMERIFPRRLGSLSYELDFLDDIPQMEGISALYSRWLEMCESYESFGTKYEKKSGLSRFIAWCGDRWNRVKRLRGKKI